jgi:arylsulfatase A-like enzyme
MTKPQNILWIMCDQLRFDYLSCYGHPHLKTPHIDALAARGVRFNRAYVQSPVCGPSRMSFYTGRYMRSHGSNWNGFPLRVGEPTLGDALKAQGVRNVLAGKTHMKADAEGLARLGIDPNSIIGVMQSECGFEPFDRDDGLHPIRPGVARPKYEAYLRDKGYDAANLWEHIANSGQAPDGTLQNGWLLAHADKEARVREEDSETPYMTQRAMQFMREAKTDGRPWCLHLSYIKPHWPYIVPAPYHDMYSASDVIPAVRSESERENPHPVYGAFMDMRVSANFSRDEVRERVIPAYMGLIKQIDDQMGVLFKFLDDEGLTDHTMIVFTADHGDYLGDHWLGEKDLFHEQSVKVPLIIADPSAAADAARGGVSDALVEAIDLAPTFVEYFGGTPAPNIMEGRSLMPLLYGQTPSDWRRFVVSEYDYSMQAARATLGRQPNECRLFMVFDGRWKYIHAPGYRPMLYDLASDPNEYVDLGADTLFVGERERLRDLLLGWALGDHNRITMADKQIAAYSQAAQLKSGILIGYFDEAEVARAKAQYKL